LQTTSSHSDFQRFLNKTLNFGIAYGQTADGLAEELGVSIQRAEALLAAHAAAYPGITARIAAVHQQASNVGEVRTLYGRRRSLPNIYSANEALAAEARRQAVVAGHSVRRGWRTESWRCSVQ
jgi:DNA polymerase-1